jgi:cyclopropane fatty-acyl-phospholipid synthase-like methyltransferase
MLDHLHSTLALRGILDVELQQANVLDLDGLPTAWTDYDVIVSAAMLEYIERSRFVDALKAVRARLSRNGSIVLFITRRNFFTRVLVGYWWKSNLYTRDELAESFLKAGFTRIDFGTFPPAARYMSVWGHIVEARR